MTGGGGGVRKRERGLGNTAVFDLRDLSETERDRERDTEGGRERGAEMSKNESGGDENPDKKL